MEQDRRTEVSFAKTIMLALVAIVVASVTLSLSGVPTAGARLAAQNVSPGQPSSIGVVMGEFKPLPQYDAALHQAKLGRPRRWCGPERKPEPLLREAIEIASGRSEVSGMEGMRRIHQIPIVAANEIAFTRDETICERAAKAYDRIAYSGSTLLSEHTRIQPVLVIRLGDRWLVEEARPRGGIWEVMFFDLTWTHQGFGYGAGA